MKQYQGIVKRNFTILITGIRLLPRLFVLRLFLTLVSVLINVINLISPQYLILSLKEQNMEKFFLCVFVLGGVNFLLSSVSIVINPIVTKLDEKLNVMIIDDFLKKAISIPLEIFEGKEFYNKYSLVFDKSNVIFQNVFISFFQGIVAIAQIIAVFTILSWMDPMYLYILLLFAFVQTFLGNFIKKAGYQLQIGLMGDRKKLNYIYRLFYIPEFMRDIRINSLFEFIFGKKKEPTEKIINATHGMQLKISKYKFVQLTCSLFESLMILGYLGYMVVKEIIWYDTFIVSYNSYTQLKNSVMNVLSILNSLYENDLYIKDYFEFMTSIDNILSGELTLSSELIQEIEFVNVSFSYPNSSKEALHNVSLKINKGEKVLIVGGNGAGKTTIIKLLLRLYEPKSGRILINGIDIAKYDLHALRSSLAVLFQDYAIYAFRLHENICLSNELNDERIYKVLERVKLKDAISKLDDGLDTPMSCQVEEHGIELSGGEKQRLAIARTLYKESSVIILDEPTSNIDSETTEWLITPILEKEKQTLIVISHDFSFANNMSKIVCFDSGSILEVGTCEDLLNKSNGLFKKLYREHQRR